MGTSLSCWCRLWVLLVGVGLCRLNCVRLCADTSESLEASFLANQSFYGYIGLLISVCCCC